MADHSAALKHIRQSARRHSRNQLVVSNLKTLVKKVHSAVSSSHQDEAKALLAETTSALDRAVTKGVIKRKTASRKISRLTLEVKKGLSPQKSA